ncbi:aldehyde dehydrogenase [Rhypophila decipiens]|uniref:aldehyde dehydrogenase (NAD(+)) n=1 Tax=Rhypophila decipiens TaxID=261697 RepID=A0AAN7B4U2_9PEZI|nr:aldehyde dehydrogenase [Rhypophila decipiens]
MVDLTVPIRPRMLINGELVEASDKGTFPLYNPATREISAHVPEATEADTNAAIAAAKAAFPAWSALDPTKRAAPMKKLAALLREHNSTLGHLEAISMGQPVSKFIYGFTGGSMFDTFAESWHRIQGQSSITTPGQMHMTLRQPYGVVAVILPWNNPVHFFCSKSAPALITGNTVVLKSSEKGPLAVAFLAELVVQAGFPPGVFNIISGHGLPSGRILSRHMDVRALTFTGSSRTGKLIQEEAARSNLKKVILELGGKSPAIVFNDANLDKAVDQTEHSIQTNSGQICMANSRIYVQREVAGEFIAKFKQKFGNVKAGDPTSKETNHGPQADEVQYRNIMGFIEEGKKSGKLELGGVGKLDDMGGYFIEPTVFTDTPEDAKIMKEEVFGPVVNINVFDTEEEVIKKANDSEYGLYAAVYTRDINRAMRMVKALESGYVAVNCTSPVTGRDLPFGGWKGSGQGREGVLYSMDNFLEIKSVIIQLED